MVNILLEGYDIDAPWLKEALSGYILPDMKVAVAALSFRKNRVRSANDWDNLYAPDGKFYNGITAGFMSYGIPAEKVSFIDYFRDTKESAVEKICKADILYFLGGMPDLMYERIEGLGLGEPMRNFKGIVMGYSAGAVIQLSEYHLSPDADYPEFGYHKGLGYLDGFYHEVHYTGSSVQNDAIRRVLSERHRPVYATRSGQGAMIIENGDIRMVGEVKLFEP